MSVLSAFYDLKVSPATYDIFEFLYQAEIERLDNGCEFLDVFIVANDTNNGFREEKTSPHPLTELNWRLRNILLPAGTLLPSVRRTVHVLDRHEASQRVRDAFRVFPHDYAVENPIASYMPSEMLLALYEGKKLGSFRAPPEARNHAKTWLDAHSGGLKPIVITIRTSSYHSWRNSFEDEWKRFTDWLDKETYFPVIVKDTERLFDLEPSALDAFPQFDIAALDLQVRLGLYECAYLNMMLSSGPATLCFLDDSTRAVRFKLLAPGDQTSNYASRGFQWGMQWPNSTTFQKSVWEEDRFETLVREFEDMISIIEGHQLTEERHLPDILQTISLFIAGENFASAERLLQPLIAREPENPELTFLLARTLHGQEHYEDAILVYRRLILQIGDNTEVLAGLGKSLLKNLEYQQAKDVLLRAQEAGTTDPFAMIDLADACCAMSLDEEALRILEKTAADLGPEHDGIASWETGKRMITLLSDAGEFEDADEVARNMRERFGHYSEISESLAILETRVRAKLPASE